MKIENCGCFLRKRLYFCRGIRRAVVLIERYAERLVPEVPGGVMTPPYDPHFVGYRAQSGCVGILPVCGAHWLPAHAGLSRGDFLYRFFSVVKTTTCEKVGKSAKGVAYFYVNQKWISTFHSACGKPLWKRLWRMWKTMSYQQIFRFFPP